MSTQKKEIIKVITPEGRVSFPSVFEASGMEGQVPKFGLTLLFPKTADISKLKDACKRAIEQAFPDPTKRPKGLKNPIRDGDEKDGDGEFKRSEEYRGHWFITPRSVNKPGLVDTNNQPILTHDEFYAGCYARASITSFFYDKSGNKGVAFGLNNVQKLREGERLSGRASAEDDFGPPVAGKAGAVPKVEEATDAMFN